jgi:hypothetical protein
MTSRPSHPGMETPVTLQTFQQLCGAAADTRFQMETWEIVEAALRDWRVRNAPGSFGMPKTAGLQWKDVFLPNGTLLRTVFQGKNFHCIVEDDHLSYLGKPTSPSGFANAVGGVGRNAWLVIWVLLPETATWQLAHTLRTTTHRRKHPRKNLAQREAPLKGG